MSDVTQSELLINALLDGQLDAGEAERVSQQIADDEQLSEMLAKFTEQRAAVADLPQYKLKDRFADRVLEIAAAEAAARPMLNRPPATSVDWKKYAMTLAAIAGLLMGMLVYQWTPLSEPDGPTVAVLNTAAKPPASKEDALEITAEETNKDDLAKLALEKDEQLSGAGGHLDGFSVSSGTPITPIEGSAMAKASPQLPQPKATIESFAAAPMRSQFEKSSESLGGRSASGLGEDFAENETKRFAAAAGTPALPPSTNFAISGTPMASSEIQSQPAIDQVWLLEVNDRFSQDQLTRALLSNSISVPADLKYSTEVTVNTTENVQPQDVDGIHVAAKPLQMKNALSQLSQSDAVTISAFQLPSEQALAGLDLAPEEQLASRNSKSPLSIVPPQKKAIAQKLRGNFFAQQVPKPSSMVPESFDKLEEKMGIAAETSSDHVTGVDSDRDTMGDESDASLKTQQLAEMEQLFPGSELESDRLQNFLILIRNISSAGK